MPDTNDRASGASAAADSLKDYERIYQRSSIGIFRSTPEGRYLAVNPAGARMHGYANEREFLEAVADIDQEIYLQASDRAAMHRMIEQQGAVVGFECQIFRHRTRQPVWVRQNVWPIHDADGVLLFYEGYVEDISDRKQAEEATQRAHDELKRRAEAALRERETLLNSLIENIPMSLSLKDREGRFLLVNPGFERLHAVQAADVLGKTFFDILPHEIAADAASEDRQVLESGEIMRSDYSWPAHLGRQHELIFKFPLRPREDGPITGVGVIALDVTDRELAQDELRKSEERLSQAVQLAKLGHCVWDTQGDRCLYCSDEYARVHGTTPEDYIARASTPKLNFTHPDDQPAYREAIESLARGQGFELEYRVVTPTGETRYVREIAKPVFDESGQVVQEICTIQDITEVKATEVRLAQAQRMEAVGQLTGGIAHDFNNLLAIIGGNAEMLARQAEAESANLQAILRASQRGAELTRRLLAFSRQQPLLPQTIDMAALVGGLSELLRRTLQETIDIATSAPTDLWFASADPGQVENALLNLAINARDAMPEGGKLTVECHNVRLDGTFVAGNPEVSVGDYVVLAVSDTGVGMESEVLAQAFEPFFTTKEVGQGTGLGLSMVYGFAKQSGGHVAIYSEPGQGTTVNLYLPRAAQGSPVEEAEAGEAIPQGQGEVILLLEDDADVRSLTVELLRQLSYQVIDVADAAAAHEALARAPRVDLVLSDVVLPGGTSGPEFVEEACARHPGLRVVFMSGYPAEAAKRNGFLGSDRVLLNKPFQMAKLARTLREVLSQEP